MAGKKRARPGSIPAPDPGPVDPKAPTLAELRAQARKALPFVTRLDPGLLPSRFELQPGYAVVSPETFLASLRATLSGEIGGRAELEEGLSLSRALWRYVSARAKEVVAEEPSASESATETPKTGSEGPAPEADPEPGAETAPEPAPKAGGRKRPKPKRSSGSRKDSSGP